MKKIIYLSCLLCSSVFLQAQLPPLQEKAMVVKRMIELNHLAPRPVNDSFSVALFNALLKKADQRGLFFTDAEYKLLLVHSSKLDDELEGRGFAFYPLFESLYQKGLLRADSIIKKQLQKPFDFLATETITSAPGSKVMYAADIPALANRWSRYLKMRALEQLYAIAAADTTGKTTLKMAVTASETTVRENIKLAEGKNIKKILDYPAGFTAFTAELYLNAIATGFDPHTNYFSPTGKEAFREALSTEALSFGLSLSENEKGEIIIEQLAPGGPAWKSGDMNKGDQLISLLWEGKELVELAGLSLEDVYDILDQPNNGRLVFKFRKADGTMKTVLLRKEKIENEENIVKGFVLKGEKKIGYILLPAFYTEWENETGSSCANDVAKEIVKLKKENIDGLILDVRYNGGGSLAEAMEMMGIFIDEGPLTGVKEKQGKLVYLKDPNRGTIYSGPMALMINGQSASASELLAATLQDYNRAVIIGSPSYGKATMQQLFALDTFSKKPASGRSDKDMIKISNGKLYRLTGETAQLNGVSPDIVLPDAFDGMDYREKFSPTALPADAVAKNNYYKPLPALPVAALAGQSRERVSKGKEFSDIQKITEEIRSRRSKTITIPLKAEAFEQWARLRELELERVQGSAERMTAKFAVDNHSLDKALLVNNEYAREINKNWLLDIGEDIYIEEAFLVLCDLINLQKPKN